MRPAYGVSLTIQRALPDTKGAIYAFHRGYTVVFGHDRADLARVKREVSEVIHEEDTSPWPEQGPFTWAIVIPGDQAEAMMDLLFGDDEETRADAEAAILSLPIGMLTWWTPERWARGLKR